MGGALLAGLTLGALTGEADLAALKELSLVDFAGGVAGRVTIFRTTEKISAMTAVTGNCTNWWYCK
ncbi:hypothetical protein OK016_28650 [Vibrio chagasii]|nr:hypothetical protein [Vibrio chagasii]